VLPWFENRKKEMELANRPLIREQAFGESLDPDKLERLGRYEVHLNRKLELRLGFIFDGARIPLINPQRGIFKPQQM
jgi:hypothetical protein